MWSRNRTRIRVVVLFFLAASILSTITYIHAAGERCFRETGHCITGRFRTYWEQNGGLPVFGYPITPAREETNPVTGETRLTQWFERARFELHPENAPPYDVLLGRLGADLLQSRGYDWWTLPAGQPREGCLFFEATRHTLCEPFLSNWSMHGLELDGQPGKSYAESLALLGAPISEPRWELHGGADASVRLTQWFERARFEWHAEQSQMLMGLLGVELYALLHPPAAPTAPEPAPAPEPDQTTTATPPASQPQRTPTPSTDDEAEATPTSTPEGSDAEEPEDETPTTTATPDDETPTTTTTPTPSPTLPPRSLNNCEDDPNKANAANFPIRIVEVDKEDEVVRLRNVSEDSVNLDGWTMCSVAGRQVHTGIGGTLEAGETEDFEYTGSGEIWNDDGTDNGALYNRDGQLVSYWFDPD